LQDIPSPHGRAKSSSKRGLRSARYICARAPLNVVRPSRRRYVLPSIPIEFQKIEDVASAICILSTVNNLDILGIDSAKAFQSWAPEAENLQTEKVRSRRAPSPLFRRVLLSDQRKLTRVLTGSNA